MASFDGKYNFEKEDNIEVYFKTLGLTEEQIKGVLTASKQVEIKVDGNEYTISSGMGTRTYPLSKEIDEKLPDGKSMKSTASVTGNQFIVSSVGNDGKKGKRVYEVSDSGLKLTLSTEGAGSGSMYFKRA